MNNDGENLYYDEHKFVSLEFTHRELSSGDAERVGHAIFHASLNMDDWKWIQGICLQFSKNENPYLVEMALKGFGNIGRVHGCIEFATVMPVLVANLDSKYDVVRDAAEVALLDLRLFCGFEHNKEQMQKIFVRDNSFELFINLYVYSKNEPDFNFVIKNCVRILDSKEVLLRAASIDVLTEIACKHGVDSNIETAFKRGLGDSHWWVRKLSFQGISAIETFTGIKIDNL